MQLLELKITPDIMLLVILVMSTVLSIVTIALTTQKTPHSGDKKTLWYYCKKHKKTTMLAVSTMALFTLIILSHTYTNHMTNQVQNGSKEEQLSAFVWLSKPRIFTSKTDWKKIPTIKHIDISKLNLSMSHLQNIKIEKLIANSTVFVDANLRRSKLKGASLTKANLTRANLKFCELATADLTTANLTKADLVLANLVGTELQGAKLIEADLTGAKLTKANLTEANLTGAYLTGTNLNEVIFVRAQLIQANLIGTYLEKADLTGADLKGAELKGSSLKGSNLTGANLTEASLAQTYIAEADLITANLTKADLTSANLTRAYLKRAKLTEASCKGTDFTDTDLTAADLTKIDLTDANLTGADLTLTILYKSKLPKVLKVFCMENAKLLPKQLMLEIKQKQPKLMEWWTPENDKHSAEYFGEMLKELNLTLEEVMSDTYSFKDLSQNERVILQQIRPDLF